MRRIAAFLLWPFRRFFDPRFQGVAERVDAARNEGDARDGALAEQLREQLRALTLLQEQTTLLQEQTRHDVDELHALIRADMEATSDAVTVLGHSLRDLETALEEVRGLVEDHAGDTEAIHEVGAP